MAKKYELTQNSVTVKNSTLYQIRALRGFGSVTAGDLGGYIESEKNLSHDNDCWVYENARVFGDAHVFGNSGVYGNARVSGDAQVFGNARVYGNAYVSGDACVFEDAHVYGKAWVSGNARVYGDALVYGDAWVYGGAQVYGYAQIYGNALVYRQAHVSGDARLGYVPVDFDCDFDPYESVMKIFNHKEILPVLLGIDLGLNKMISEKLK